VDVDYWAKVNMSHEGRFTGLSFFGSCGPNFTYPHVDSAGEGGAALLLSGCKLWVNFRSGCRLEAFVQRQLNSVANAVEWVMRPELADGEDEVNYW